MKNIAVLCPIHRRPDLVIEQLKNYEFFSSGHRFFHVLHISLDGSSNFHENFKKEILERYGCFCDRSVGTSFQCTMGAILECSKKIKDLEVDYVYLHTDGDLLVKGNLMEYIVLNQLAYSGHRIDPSWFHHKKMISDENYRKLRLDLNIDDKEMLFGRQEGSFFPKDLWLKISDTISKYYDEDFFHLHSNHWPLEEALIPTLAHRFTNGKGRVRNIIRTKEGFLRDSDVNCVSLEDVKAIQEDLSIHCAGLKWFSQDIFDEARAHLGAHAE